MALFGGGVAFALLFSAAQPAAAQVVYHKGTTRKMMQLTGDYDQALRRPTKTLTQTNYGLVNTDLGQPFMHNNQLWFTFGDSAGRPGGNHDFIARTTATSIDNLNDLIIRKNPDNLFEFVNVPVITEGAYETPSHAVDIGGSIYIVQSTEFVNNPGVDQDFTAKSVLAKSTNDGDTWTTVYTLSSRPSSSTDPAIMVNTHFINVSMRVVDAALYPGLPWTSGNVLLIYGTGLVRKSNVYLAAIRTADIATKSNMRYLSAISGTNVPSWSNLESAAVPLFTHPMVGELSLTWNAQQNRFVMLYNAGDWIDTAPNPDVVYPRGIQMRTSVKPWGPWSAPSIIMEPGEDQAYARYMHWAWGSGSDGHLDKFQDAGRDGEFGGEYAPGLIESFTTGDATSTQVYWTMSTWNPYQTVVMKSEIGTSNLMTPPPDSGTTTLTLGDANWSKSSSTFYTSATVGGVPGISTWTSQGDASTGLMWRWLPRDQWNKQLDFSVTSGNGEVILIEGGADIPTTGNIATIYNDIKRGIYGDVVQATWGHESNSIIVPVSWKLSPFDRGNLKIVVIDHTTMPWGFVAASNMTLTRNKPSGTGVVSTFVPGDASWTKTAGTWYANFNDGTTPTISTFGPQGDANQGVMWRMLPRDWKNSALLFNYHGGQGRVFLLQGGTPIPTTGNFATIQADILAGKYGRVLESVIGPNFNTPNQSAFWSLEKYKSDDLKLVVIDSVTSSWGFIGVGQMSLVRYP